MFLISSCGTVVLKDEGIKAHWMKAGEKAPFEGILIDNATFYKVLVRLEECKHGR
jgi:hypothetical protein